jgi:hypothetical protein
MDQLRPLEKRTHLTLLKVSYLAHHMTTALALFWDSSTSCSLCSDLKNFTDGDSYFVELVFHIGF